MNRLFIEWWNLKMTNEVWFWGQCKKKGWIINNWDAKSKAIAFSIPARVRSWQTTTHTNLVRYVWMISTTNKWQQNEFVFIESLIRVEFVRQFLKKHLRFEEKLDIHIVKKIQQLHWAIKSTKQICSKIPTFSSTT